MKTLPELELTLSNSLTSADTLYHKNIKEAEEKYAKLISYYEGLRNQMIEGAKKRFEEAKQKLELRNASKASNTSESKKRGRPSKFDKELEAAKERMKAITHSTAPPLTRKEIEQQEEKKREEIRAANMSAVFGALGFESEPEEEDDWTSEDERELQQRLAEEKEKREVKKIVLQDNIPAFVNSSFSEPTPTPPVEETPPLESERTPDVLEPELTDEERKKLREEALVEDRKKLEIEQVTERTKKSLLPALQDNQTAGLQYGFTQPKEPEMQKPQLVSDTKVKKPVKKVLSPTSVGR